MQALSLALLAASLGLAAPGEVATWSFEQGLDGFTQAGGTGQVLHETARPLQGAGSLRLVLAAAALELRAVSKEFAVEPWTLYRVHMRQAADLGTDLRLGVEFSGAAGWQSGSLFRERDGGLFGVGPHTSKARLVLTLTVPGQALGRSTLVDEIRIRQQGPLVREKGPNLLWDGGFELAQGDMTHWVTKPKVMAVSTDRPREGRRCLHVEAERTYLVFPSIPVEAGHLYRFRLWVRGSGVLWPGLHKLAPTDWEAMRIDTAQRVGWASATVGEIKLTNDWQALEIVTPCESDRIVWFQPCLVFSGGQVDLDDASMNVLDGSE
jgi:hypothetical protein